MKVDKNDIQLIEPDYTGVARVLSEFEKLYKVCENKELLDECLRNFCTPNYLIKRDETNT